MGIIIPPSRALSQLLFSRAAQFCNARLATSLRRVNPVYSSDSNTQSDDRRSVDRSSILSQCRSYATATSSKAPGRPKSHTGRATTTKRKPATSTKKKTKAKAKPKAKPKKKAKAKPKPRPRKILTEKQLAAKAAKAQLDKIRELKQKALLTEPKALPSTPYLILVLESSKSVTGRGQIGETSKEASAKYKSMTPEEHERLNHVANSNKAKNAAAYKDWVSSFTPKQVLEANTARSSLRTADRKKGGKKRFTHIKDDRLVKRPANAYAYFARERNESGDMNGMKITETGGLIGKEWNALTIAQKQPYLDQSEADKKRYITEYKTVYGEDSAMATRKRKSATAS